MSSAEFHRIFLGTNDRRAVGKIQFVTGITVMIGVDVAQLTLPNPSDSARSAQDFRSNARTQGLFMIATGYSDHHSIAETRWGDLLNIFVGDQAG